MTKMTRASMLLCRGVEIKIALKYMAHWDIKMMSSSDVLEKHGFIIFCGIGLFGLGLFDLF